MDAVADLQPLLCPLFIIDLELYMFLVSFNMTLHYVEHETHPFVRVNWISFFFFWSISKNLFLYSKQFMCYFPFNSVIVIKKIKYKQRPKQPRLRSNGEPGWILGRHKAMTSFAAPDMALDSAVSDSHLLPSIKSISNVFHYSYY